MTWEDVLKDEVEKPYFRELAKRVKNERKTRNVFPTKDDMFRALELTPFDSIKVVILGQDPYHGPGQAHGLAFSVPEGQAIPPSLQNIFKELSEDVGVSIPRSGDLSKWAKQGVLLLNSILTVAEDAPASHANLGWEQFTSAIISAISAHKENVFFVLWGKQAQSKKSLIDLTKHNILQAPHPSPLSAYRGFFGSKPFSTINKAHNIDWDLTK